MNDPYIRENFRRIKELLLDIESRVSGSESSDNIINNIIAASIWKKISVNAGASSVTIIDQMSVNDFDSLKYIMSVRDETNNKTSTMELNIKNENGSLVDSVFAKMPGGISFAVDAINDSGTMKINLTNNELVSLSVISARLTL